MKDIRLDEEEEKSHINIAEYRGTSIVAIELHKRLTL